MMLLPSNSFQELRHLILVTIMTPSLLDWRFTFQMPTAIPCYRYIYNLYMYFIKIDFCHPNFVNLCRSSTSLSQCAVRWGITSAPRSSASPVSLASSFRCWTNRTVAAARLATFLGRFAPFVRRRPSASYWAGRTMGRRLTLQNWYRVGTDLFWSS